MGERSVSNRKLENIRNIRVLENRNKGCERGLLGVCHLFPSVTRVWPHPDWWSVTGPNTVQIQIQKQIPEKIGIQGQIQLLKLKCRYISTARGTMFQSVIGVPQKIQVHIWKQVHYRKNNWIELQGNVIKHEPDSEYQK